MSAKLTDEQWQRIHERMRELEREDAEAFTRHLHDGPNGDFWRFVDEQIAGIAHG